MLQITNPEILEVQQILDNIDTLLAKGFPLTREMEKVGRCNLNVVHSDCGTYRCLAGWADTIQELSGMFGVVTAVGESCYNSAKIAKNFGFNVGEHLKVFGYASQGNLDDREQYVRNVLRPRHQSRLNQLLGG